MALWGNKDSKTASGTIAIANTGVVTGTSTAFTTQAKVGNYILADGVDFEIVSITSNTVAKVIMGKNNGNGTVTVVSSGTSYTLSEKPAFVAHESAGSASGVHGDSNKVYGVAVGELTAGGDNVTEVSVATGGSLYAEAPAVTFTGGGGSGAAATATISGGKVTSIAVTNAGSSYETVPTVAIAAPVLTIATSAVNTTTETISQSLLIPANTFTTSGALEVVTRVSKTGTAGGVSIKVYKNTTNSLTGATQIATLGSPLGNTNLFAQGIKTFRINSNTLTGLALNVSSLNDFVSGTSAALSTTFTTSVDNYIIFTLALVSTADSANVSMVRITKSI